MRLLSWILHANRFLVTRCAVLWVCPFPFREPNESAFRQCTAHDCRNAEPISLPICDSSVPIAEFHWLLSVRNRLLTSKPVNFGSASKWLDWLIGNNLSHAGLFSSLIYAHEGSNTLARDEIRTSHRINIRCEVSTKYRKWYIHTVSRRDLIMINFSKFVTFRNYY